MSFCIAILTLKMEENLQLFGILCFIISRKVKTQLKCKKKKKICAVYGEGAVPDRTCQKWIAEFHAADFLLDDAPQLRRLVKIDSNQMET